MTNSPELPQLFEDDINLNGLFDILNPENNLVLADDMMLRRRGRHSLGQREL